MPQEDPKVVIRRLLSTPAGRQLYQNDRGKFNNLVGRISGYQVEPSPTGGAPTLLTQPAGKVDLPSGLGAGLLDVVTGAGRGLLKSIGNIPSGVQELHSRLDEAATPFSYFEAAGGRNENLPSIPKAEEAFPVLQDVPGEEIGRFVGDAALFSGAAGATRALTGAPAATSALAEAAGPSGLGSRIAGGIGRFIERAGPEALSDVAVGTATTGDPAQGALAAVPGVATAGLAGLGRAAGRYLEGVADRGTVGLISPRSGGQREAASRALTEINALPPGRRPVSRQELGVYAAKQAEKARGAVNRAEASLSTNPARLLDLGEADVEGSLRAIEAPAVHERYVPETAVNVGEGSGLTADDVTALLEAKSGRGERARRFLREDVGELGDFTLRTSPKTGTFSLRGPNGEKVAGRILDDRIEMVSIGKGNSPDSRTAVEALRALGRQEGKPVYFVSQNLSPSGGAFRERMSARGDLEITDAGLRLTEGTSLGTATADDLRSMIQSAQEAGQLVRLPPPEQIPGSLRAVLNRNFSDEEIRALTTTGARPEDLLQALDASRVIPQPSDAIGARTQQFRDLLSQDVDPAVVRDVSKAIQGGGVSVDPGQLGEAGSRILQDPLLAGADISPDDLAKLAAADPAFASQLGLDITTTQRRVAKPFATSPARQIAGEVANARSDIANFVRAEARRQGVPDEEIGRIFNEAPAEDIKNLRNFLARSTAPSDSNLDVLGQTTVQNTRLAIADSLELALTGAGKKRPSLRDLEDRFLMWRSVLDSILAAENRQVGNSITTALGGEAAAFALMRGNLAQALATPILIGEIANLLRHPSYQAIKVRIARPLAEALASGKTETALSLIGDAIAGASTSSGRKDVPSPRSSDNIPPDLLGVASAATR